ncbi:ABC transporter permease [Aquisalimonas asiatica]|uniref:Peptide/nickel transport system permease protein n=1 Tax=Aquisalimonas asiatica TaxID=406100 RepID=A0A1H8PZM4_9GAMM|nr:ABC transporter permease [Aquisalimonas asiatica]SEO47117.1 peptide/nickel transport system permease protein [Aquisalimonas asiatica]
MSATLLKLLVTRLGQGALIMLLVSAVIFTLLRVVPGDPARLIVGGMADDQVRAELSAELGLTDPIPVQYLTYLGNVLRGDLGQSFVRPSQSREDVTDAEDVVRGERASVARLLLERLPLSLGLAASSLLIALAISVPLGVYAGLNPGRWPDKLAFYTGSIFVSIPNFWLGLVLILVVSANLGWLPAIGYQGMAYAVLPAIVLAVEVSPVLMRTISVSMAETMQQKFIDYGGVRGLSPGRVVIAHGLRNASVPLLNVVGIQASTLLGGVVVVEYVFNYPGLGLLTIDAVLQRDFPVLQGIALFLAGTFVLVNIAVDMAAALIDPRLESE